MKKLVLTLIAIACATSLSLMAQEKKEGKKEGKKREWTAEQKAAYKKILDTYDTNKDGKLDKDERAKMTDADKAELKKITGGGEQKKKKE
jgi:hypothetical protein